MASVTWTGTITSTGGNGSRVALLPNAAGAQLPTEWVVNDGTSYLRYITLFQGSFGNFVGYVQLRFNATDSGDGNTAGPDLTPAVEAALSVTFTSGENSVTVAGPTAMGSLVSDALEPYVWQPSNNSAVSAFAASLIVGSSLTVTLRAPSPPFFADDTGDAVTWTERVPIAGVGVPDAGGDPAPTYTATGLPSGILFNAAQRVIQGTPGFQAPGSGTIVVTATNSEGMDTWRLPWTVDPQPRVFAGRDLRGAATISTATLVQGTVTPATLSGQDLTGTATLSQATLVQGPPFLLDNASLPDNHAQWHQVALLEVGQTGPDLYADSNRGGDDVPVDGSLEIGFIEVDGNVTNISRLRWDGTALILNDNDDPDILLLEDFYRPGGRGNDLTITLQTADTIARFDVATYYPGDASAGNNFVRWGAGTALPQAVQDVLSTLRDSVGTRFILGHSRIDPAVLTGQPLTAEATLSRAALVVPGVLVGRELTAEATLSAATLVQGTIPTATLTGQPLTAEATISTATLSLQPPPLVALSSQPLRATATITSAGLTFLGAEIPALASNRYYYLEQSDFLAVHIWDASGSAANHPPSNLGVFEAPHVHWRSPNPNLSYIDARLPNTTNIFGIALLDINAAPHSIVIGTTPVTTGMQFGQDPLTGLYNLLWIPPRVLQANHVQVRWIGTETRIDGADYYRAGTLLLFGTAITQLDRSPNRPSPEEWNAEAEENLEEKQRLLPPETIVDWEAQPQTNADFNRWSDLVYRRNLQDVVLWILPDHTIFLGRIDGDVEREDFSYSLDLWRMRWLVL